MRCSRSALWILASVGAAPGCLHEQLPQLSAGYVQAHEAPLPLPSDPAQGSCERQGWLSVAPATATASGRVTVGSTQGYVSTQTVTLTADGLAVLAGDDPLRFRQLDQALGSPASLAVHRRRQQRAEATRRLTLQTTGGGLAAMGVGLGLMTTALLLGGDETPTIDGLQATVAYGALGIFGIGGVIAPLGLVVPGPRAQARYGLREVLFLPQEDDLGQLEAEIEAANARLRSTCALEGG